MGSFKYFVRLQTFLVLSLCTFGVLSQDFEDISPLPTVFESKTLPVDSDGNFIARQMASVGNGHLSTTVYTDTVYVNGLYNGKRGESHRARIPSGNNIRVEPSESNGQIENQRFALDVGKGTFFERFTVNGATVEQRTFAHRVFTRVIVTQIVVNTTENGIALKVTSSPGQPSLDLTTPQTGDFGTQLGATYSCANIWQREDERYDQKTSACSISSQVPMVIMVSANMTSTSTFISAYGYDLNDISDDFNEVANMIVTGQHNEIFERHVYAWDLLWGYGSIEVEGNLPLAKVVYGSLYYILSSLPVTTSNTNSPNGQFFGLSPGGLAYGSLLRDYQGHSFWDTETWMFPSILYLYPGTARSILDYRLYLTQAARDHANETGYKGARFPWESAATGREVTPDCCPETRDLQVHITSDISFAIRQYIAMTRDIQWLRNTPENFTANGCALLRDIAEFWTSRATYNATTGYHDIRGIMPPDEDNHGVDNNGYTNIGAGYSIFFAKYAWCLCSGNDVPPIPDEWLELAASLKLLYDEELDYHPEYEGYQFGTSIKQADVVLMGFPQLYDMKPSTRRNDLLIYANVTRDNGPAMTWAMHTIGFLELDDLDEAAHIFNRSYQWYMREPFKIWTEAIPPNLGAINFITGMGGFLQSVFSGYGGVRVYPEKLTISKPRVLPQSTGLVFKGLKYLGNVINVNITSEKVALRLVFGSPQYPLQIQSDNDTQPVDFVGTMEFSTEGDQLNLEITTKTPSNCPLPHDKIGVPRSTARKF